MRSRGSSCDAGDHGAIDRELIVFSSDLLYRGSQVLYSLNIYSEGVQVSLAWGSVEKNLVIHIPMPLDSRN